MYLEQLFQSVFGFEVWLLVKGLFLVGMLVYCVFSFVVVRQVKLMTGVVHGLLSRSLQVLAWTLFLFSIFVLVATLLFL